MPSVLILGATGYIGLPLGLALLRTGSYRVYGLARSQSKATHLASQEITPIIGDANKPWTWAPSLASLHIDLVVDCASAYENPGGILETVITEATRRKDALASEGKVGPKMGFLYVSGTWVHGNAVDGFVATDTNVPGSKLAKSPPTGMTNWRAAHEPHVLAARDLLDVAIVRPALVYGRASWILDAFLGEIRAAMKSGDVARVAKIPLDKDARQVMVHVDDVVDGLVRAAASIEMLGSWPVFDLTAEAVEMQALMEASAKAMGFKGKVELAGSQGNAFFEAVSLRQCVDSQRARLALEWTPKRTNLLINIEPIVKAWVATQDTKEASVTA